MIVHKFALVLAVSTLALLCAGIGNKVERRHDNNEPDIDRVSVRPDNGRIEWVGISLLDMAWGSLLSALAAAAGKAARSIG